MSSKVILVTGANTGIGFELTRVLAEKGNTVYLAARKEAAGKEAEAKLVAEGLKVKYVHLDVTDIESIKAAKATIENAEGRLDVLVNNAGHAAMSEPQNPVTLSLEVVRSTFEPNFFGLIATTTTFIPLLRKSSNPVILNVSTDMASNNLQAGPKGFLHEVAAYNTSKAAANSYTIGLAHELKSEGFKVNAVTPGFTSTKLNGFSAGGKSERDGAMTLVNWALLDKNGPTGKFIDEKGDELEW